MDATAEDGPAGALVVDLAAGESVLAASDALVDHTGGVRVERTREGALRSVADAASERERTPVRVAASAAATVRLAPNYHGDVVACDPADGVAAVRDAFLAAGDGARIGADRVGDAPARGDGLFLTAVTGGTAFLAGRGRVDRVSVPAGGERVVSAPHVVAFDRDADVTVEREGALEGATPACRVSGPATAWVATRGSRE